MTTHSIAIIGGLIGALVGIVAANISARRESCRVRPESETYTRKHD